MCRVDTTIVETESNNYTRTTVLVMHGTKAGVFDTPYLAAIHYGAARVST
jgi:hypothetical protein